MSNTIAQHAYGSDPQSPAREIAKCILVVTPLAFWAFGCSIPPTETLLLEYSRAAVRLSSNDRSAVTKGLGTTALVYIFQTIIVEMKYCLGHP